MSTTQIGAQMYTLREHLKDPVQIAGTCRRVKQMGYDAIQVSAFGPIETAELGRILRDEGLICAATHVSLDLLKDVSACVDYHEALGCRYPAIGGYKAEQHTAAAYAAFAAEFSRVARPLAEHGLEIGYHNHSRELARVDDCDRRILDVLIQESDPSVWFEIDVYWVAHGGGDPAAWIDKVPGRVPCVHVKDMDITVEQEQKILVWVRSWTWTSSPMTGS